MSKEVIEIPAWIMCKKHLEINAKNIAIVFSEDEIEDWLEKGDVVMEAVVRVKKPEKKITMSESEFRQLYKDLCKEAYQQKSAGDMWEPNKYMEYALKFEEKK